jgi:hypothetical protein
MSASPSMLEATPTRALRRGGDFAFYLWTAVGLFLFPFVFHLPIFNGYRGLVRSCGVLRPRRVWRGTLRAQTLPANA